MAVAALETSTDSDMRWVATAEAFDLALVQLEHRLELGLVGAESVSGWAEQTIGRISGLRGRESFPGNSPVASDMVAHWRSL